jgi:hypothetical protein
MSDPKERSPSGAPILRHAGRVQPIGGAPAPTSLEPIEAHIAAHLGPTESVLHELVSDLVHVDVHVVAPAPARDYWTLVTSGMSDRPMQVPEGAGELRYAELMLSLPPEWQLSPTAFEDEQWYWPIRWLKLLARLPHEYDTWLGWGHTVPNGEPPEPFAPSTGQCCMLVELPMLCPDAFRELRVDAEKTIRFYSLVPIYREEMDLKLAEGCEALETRFDRFGVTELLDPQRPNTGRAAPRLRPLA